MTLNSFELVCLVHKLSMEASWVVCARRRGVGYLEVLVWVSRISRRADVRTGRDAVLAIGETG